jgi:hypothetical protein
LLKLSALFDFFKTDCFLDGNNGIGNDGSGGGSDSNSKSDRLADFVGDVRI